MIVNHTIKFMKKIAVMFADGFEEIEALGTVDILRRAGVTCDIVSIQKETVTGAHGIKIQSDKIISEDIKNYDMIVCPGGLPGAEYLSECELLIETIKEFGQNLWADIVGYFTGNNVTASVTREDQIELAQHLQDMGYDVIGYGFADASYEYDDEENSDKIDGFTNDTITDINIAPKAINKLFALFCSIY